jgi:hypothetical protein
LTNPENEQLKDIHAEEMESLSDDILKKLEEGGIETAVVIYKFPDDPDGTFRTMKRGHFYDSLKLISDYSRQARQRVMSELGGLV